MVRDEVYRIGYEAIRNACMHSGGSRLEVGLGSARDLILRVADNGAGIDLVVASGGRKGHYGLQGMRERAGGSAPRSPSRVRRRREPRSGCLVPGRVVFHSQAAGLFTRLARFFFDDGGGER